MTLEQFIAERRPCPPAVAWCQARSLTDMHTIWQALCQDDLEQTWDWLRWGLRALPLPRRAALLAEMLRRQPVGGGRVLLDLLTDERSRAVLPLLDRWAAGETVPDDEVVRIRSAACDAAWSAACDAACDAAWSAACDAAWSAAWAADAASAAVRWQRDLFRRHNPFEVSP